MKFSHLLLLSIVASLIPAATAAPLTARQVIERIQQNVGVPWRSTTVDTFKAGDPDTPVKGITVTMMATFDVLEGAAKSGNNLVITHEPTFYNHQDNTADLAKQQDAVLADKEAFIKQHNLVVWRFHDHWHARRPDGILLGMVKALGWEKLQSKDDPRIFILPGTTLDGLSREVKHKLGIRAVRVVGDRSMKTQRLAFMPGAGGSARQIQLLERSDVDVLMIGETPEWETVEYVADAVSEHKHKALIILGHIPSEQAGMEECTRWLKTFVSEIPVAFVPAKEPFWLPE